LPSDSHGKGSQRSSLRLARHLKPCASGLGSKPRQPTRGSAVHSAETALVSVARPVIDDTPLASIRGIFPALVTPLTAEGEIDASACQRLINHVLAGGVHGV